MTLLQPSRSPSFAARLQTHMHRKFRGRGRLSEGRFLPRILLLSQSCKNEVFLVPSSKQLGRQFSSTLPDLQAFNCGNCGIVFKTLSLFDILLPM